MKLERKHLAVYFVMGSLNCPQDPLYVLEQALLGGVTMFQFREKGTGCVKDDEKVGLARKLQSLCRSYKVPFIVNDDIELAIDLGADGVHIGREDLPITEARKKIGRNRILGVSAHDVNEAKAAIEAGAEYLGVGPMFPTKTKPDIREVQGPSIIREIRQQGITIPLVGIGGIDETNAHHVIEAGADGVAVISAISQNGQPKTAAQQLQKTILI